MRDIGDMLTQFIARRKWKLVWGHTGRKWELYDMDTDRSELNDLSYQYPEIVEPLTTRYEEWEEKVGVVPWEEIK